jgi:glycosyltransferase involved in cell wall biosynthesis
VSGLAVAIDARRLQDDPAGGAGRALAGMLPGVASACAVTLLTDGRRPLPSAVTAAAPGANVVPLALPGGLPEVAWLHGPARRWLRRHPQLFHGTFAQLPIGLRSPAVVTVNDLSFELHDEDFGRAKRAVFRRHARSAVRRARTTIVPSGFTADQVVAHYDIPPARVEVIPIAVDPSFAPARAHDTGRIAATGLDGPYVVAVGGARRRGLEVAIGAWRHVRDRGVPIDLAVVGAPGLVPEPGLHDLGRLDDPTWAAVLAGAAALCYPTRYEGFGLPALEAAASGTPVVCARVASLPEVLGDAAAWCDEPTTAAIADRLHAVLTDRGLAAELRARGLARAAATLTWADIADRHVEVYGGGA